MIFDAFQKVVVISLVSCRDFMNIHADLMISSLYSWVLYALPRALAVFVVIGLRIFFCIPPARKRTPSSAGLVPSDHARDANRANNDAPIRIPPLNRAISMLIVFGSGEFALST
jgi:hypothetical protein